MITLYRHTMELVHKVLQSEDKTEKRKALNANGFEAILEIIHKVTLNHSKLSWKRQRILGQELFFI